MPSGPGSSTGLAGDVQEGKMSMSKKLVAAIALILVAPAGGAALADDCANLTSLEIHQSEVALAMARYRNMIQDVQKKLDEARAQFDRKENPHPKAVAHAKRVVELETYVNKVLLEAKAKLNEAVGRYNEDIKATEKEVKEIPAAKAQLKCKK